MNIDPTKLRGPLSFEKFASENGWCSAPFFQLSVVLIEMLTARGVTFAFSRVGPILSLNGERLFLVTTGYSPPPESNMPALIDRADNYMHIIDMNRNPIFQIYARDQQKLVQFMNIRFADLLAQSPATSEELIKIRAAVQQGNAGVIGGNTDE